ncbi:hypothetical protein ACFCYA_29875, partial [Streptomyces virginiae]
MSGPATRTQGPRGLRRFAGPRPPRPETCELCGVGVAAPARHLVEAAQPTPVIASPPTSPQFAPPRTPTRP